MNQTSENIPHPSFTSRVFVSGDGLKKQKQGSRKIALTYLQWSKLAVINNPVALFLIFQSIFFSSSPTRLHFFPSSVLPERFKILEHFPTSQLVRGVLRERVMVTAGYDAGRRGGVCAQCTTIISVCVRARACLWVCVRVRQCRKMIC